jgi:hypothetical protein
METVNLTENSSIDFHQARRQAAGKAGESMREPVIITWKDDNSGQIAPDIPGAAPDRWRNYAENFGGKLTVNVGDRFHFVFNESVDFESPEINVATLTEQDGTSIMCTVGACTEEERRKLGYFAGGGAGG